jgi:hypothetical protein
MGTFKGIICAAAIAALGVTATGCEEDDDFVPVDGVEFDAVDANGDGLVSPGEWNAAFVAWDIDNDGYIAPAEYPLAAGFDELDVDRNTLLTLTEWDAATVAWDLNTDGSLDSEELRF